MSGPAKGDDRCAHANINGKRERADSDDREIDEEDRYVLAITSEVVKILVRGRFFTVTFKVARAAGVAARVFTEPANCTDEIA